MALDSKRVAQVVAMYRDRPEPERHVCIGRAIEALATRAPSKGGRPRREQWRENIVADTLAMAVEQWPGKTADEHQEWLGAFFNLDPRTVRTYLQAHRRRIGSKP